MTRRTLQGANAFAAGLDAEAIAAHALEQDGWHLHARRLRTAAGDIDLIAEKDGLLAIVEVKHRATLAGAAASLGPRQRRRLIAAAELVLAAHPGWGATGIRFDVIVIDRTGAIRRIADAFRLGDSSGPGA